MEAAGFAVGIAGLAGLFSACLEAVNRAQSYRSFASDAKALDLQFTATKVRLENWGRAVGILDLAQAANGADNAPRHHPALDNVQIQKAALDVFGFVKEICESAGAGKLRLGAVDPSQPPDPLRELGNSSKRKLAWAMGGKLRRTEQIELFKELVQTLYNLVPPDDYEAGAPIVTAWSAEFSQIVARLEAQARRDVHAWLRHVPGERYRDSLQRRLEGTCLWILQEEQFLQWKSHDLTSDSKILWIHGPAGFGKTILCANMVQHLTTELDTPTAHFFFSSEAGSRDDPFLAVRCWVSQVISCNEEAFRLALQHQESDKDPSATRHTIMELFEALIRLIPGCTFVLDGLDECTTIDGDAQNCVVTFLGAVTDAIASTETRLLVVSRFLAGIQHSLQGKDPSKLLEIKLRPNDVEADIIAYSRDIVDKKLRNKPAALRSSLCDTIVKRCEGQFLWIRLQGESLRRGMSKKQLEETVKDTPTDLERIYDHSWTMITQLKDGDKNRAFSLLRWAAFAERPLSIDEVAEAILVEESHALDIHDLCDIDNDYVDTEIVGLCGSLLEIDMETDESLPSRWTLHLPHFTVREFLAGRLPTPGWIMSANLQPSPEMLHHALLSEVCLRYISLPKVWTLPWAPESRIAGISFRSYATDTWHWHMKSGVPSDSRLMELAMEFFRLDNPSWVAWSALKMATGAQLAGEESTEKSSPFMRPIQYALYLDMPDLAVSLVRSSGCEPEDLDATVESAFRDACRSGLTSVMRAMIERGADATSIGDDGWSPLHLVAGNGHVDAARLLLANNTDARVMTKAGTPLHQAARSGSVDMVKLLLENHAAATINSIAGHEGAGITPLHVVCAKGNVDIARLLLSHGADPSISTSKNMDAINLAATLGHPGVVQLLMENDVEHRGFSDDSRELQLAAAAAGGNLALVSSLLEMGADATAVVGSYRISPLQQAALNGHEHVMATLIANGADVNGVDPDGCTMLMAAVTSGQPEAVRLLLDHGVDVNNDNAEAMTDRNPRWTTLSWAIIKGHYAIAELLLKYGANYETANTDGSMPLGLAVKHGRLDVIRLLLEDKVDPNTVDGRGCSPLRYAVALGHMAAIEMLLHHKADPNAVDELGFSPIRHAARFGAESVINVLLHHGASMETDNSPLFVAAWTGRAAVVRLLLQASATPSSLVNCCDYLGRSPLFYASKAGRLSVVQLLLETGAEQDAMDWKGWTPLSAAVHCGHSKVASILRDCKDGPDEREKLPQDEDDDGSIEVTETRTDTDPTLCFCDACLLDISPTDGQACAMCASVGFFLCAGCYGAAIGCPYPSHEFWPKTVGRVEFAEADELLMKEKSPMDMI
ncbi:ankyrin repeat-containing domain protein [Plectosphaerella plurivora]|uniref:Ankyrin repeat-containing domain protein n=1 Tax=Plectosphaerella plurivora TaxID=936078 RepID=A0A9P9ABU0_9PEZI|nr:ankyrin repeat-containing domain protein [Plectosphaerella plurivora]